MVELPRSTQGEKQTKSRVAREMFVLEYLPRMQKTQGSSQP